jgi:hypothetical protein
MTKGMKLALESIINSFINNLKNDLSNRWNLLKIEMSQKEVYEVLSAQLARQITLASQFATNINCWTFDIAPIILRCMADNYINFAWIAKAPSERSKKFILFGLGQEKLNLEHRKTQIIYDGGNPETDQVIKFIEAWLNTQRYTFLTEVNLGSWSGISTRQMAIEADCIDFYNFVYTPFSTAAHNTWGHLAKYNLVQSSNPLHKYLRKPVIGNLTIDVYNFQLAAKYVGKMIMKFDEVFLLKIQRKSTYAKFMKQFTAFEKRFLTAPL